MTTEEILALEPGRELDCLIAEKIFGWYNTNKTTGMGDKPNYYGFYGLEISRYSTDIAAAWEVVKKTNMLNNYVLHYAWNKWHISENDYGDLHDIAEGKTAPEAISKAALMLVMNKK